MDKLIGTAPARTPGSAASLALITSTVHSVYIDMNTLLTISQADGRPMYLQIMEQIRHHIAAGNWTPGREIPSIRALAAELRVSVITVKRAYSDLEHEGVIVTRQGRGTFVSESAKLGENLQLRELTEHLDAAATLARRLGLSDKELHDKLTAAQRQQEPSA